MLSDYQRKGIPEDYIQILQQLKEKQGKIFWQTERKEAKITAIKQYLQDENLSFSSWSLDEISEKLYNDIFEKSILTAPLDDIWVKRILITSWNKVTVVFINDQKIEIDEFYSSEHARETLLSLNHNISPPCFSGNLGGNLRITAFFPPFVSEKLGVVCSIDKLGQRNFTMKMYQSSEFATREELEFLSLALRYGISVLIVGKWLSGKSSLMNYLLSTLQELTTVTFEQYREMLNTISLLDSRMESAEAALKLDPDVIALNLDDAIPQEISLRGYTTLASVIAQGPIEGLYQLTEQWRRQMVNPLDYQSAFRLTCTAMPIVVTVKAIESKYRIVNISECDQSNISTLWECTGNRHDHVSDPSEKTFRTMQQNGCSIEQLNQIRKKVKEVC
ncbi:hypothetical protein [Faecalispora anaeroviscerum]|uniref:hypothetical protein n=1 Tax=Faecalispora anaeroviscerum TaxID=2991836 RepID=UPI0024BAB0DC|nr:hypothetical protein [Faecalispora anaeroviscerum]